MEYYEFLNKKKTRDPENKIEEDLKNKKKCIKEFPKLEKDINNIEGYSKYLNDTPIEKEIYKDSENKEKDIVIKIENEHTENKNIIVFQTTNNNITKKRKSR